MKKYIFLVFIALSISTLRAQGITDALRYSQDDLIGTARFRAMGGAFGALGGDLSSLNSNPAGSAVFANSQLGVTISDRSVNNKSDYFGMKSGKNDNSFLFSQVGGVMVFGGSNPSKNWKKLSIAVNYNDTNNYGNDIFSMGVNPRNSIDQYFLDYAKGVPLGSIDYGDNTDRSTIYQNLSYNKDKQALMGYWGRIIRPVNPNDKDNIQYTTNVPTGGNYYQENEINTKGYSGKLSFNAATSYKDKLFIGINLNSHFADYTRNTSFYEDNKNNTSTTYQINRLRFDNQLYTHGGGFSFQLGAIAKITEQIRLGVAYESNTWYTLHDETTQKLSAVTNNKDEEKPTDIVDPQIVNEFPSYNLQTPGKWTGSFAYVFGKKGLISIDYAAKDYGNIKLKPLNDFRGANNSMSNQLTNSNEVRIGAEYRIKLLSLRAGYRYEGSPYKNKSIMGDLNGYSGGLGYNFGATKLDLAYSYAKRNSYQAFFNEGAFTDGANLSTNFNTVSLTLLFEL